MEKGYQTIYWQNLLEKKCPKCGGEMYARKTGGVKYRNCFDELCGWGISEERILDHLKDPEHPIHRYTSPVLEDKIADLSR